jgi:hypothetical protein
MIAFADRPEEVTDFTRSVEAIEGRLLYTVRGSLLVPDNSRALCSTQRTCDYVQSAGAHRDNRPEEALFPQEHCYGKE